MRSPRLPATAPDATPPHARQRLWLGLFLFVAGLLAVGWGHHYLFSRFLVPRF